MRNNLCFVLYFSLLLLIFFPACSSGKKEAAKKDYGKPVWLETDASKFPAFSDDETSLEGGKITVFDPQGWERQPRGAAKAKKGFKTVIVFTKDSATLMMTRSVESKGLPNLDEENIETFAENAQQLFKSKVQMVKLGSQVGVYFSRRIADAQRLKRSYERRIVATVIDGDLYTYELILTEGKIDDALRDILFAMVSKVKIVGTEEAKNENKPEPAEKSAVIETKPEPEVKPIEVIAAEPVPKKEEAVPKEPNRVEKPVEVAVEAKPVPKPAKKKPVDKKSTKAVLDELDALLN